MDKHNVVDLEAFIQNKRQVKFEQTCLDMLDKMGEKISEMQTYIMNFKAYIENMVTDGYIKESFANNIIQQVELISMKASAYIARQK